VIFNSPENVKALTHLSSYERLRDGRPRVPDDLLERLKLATNDEAWAIVTRKHGYHAQFAGSWPVHLQADRVLVGRAVTAVFVPLRPDLNAAVETSGKAEGRVGRHNAWVIECLEPGDVPVIDLFGKLQGGTFIGDNLATAIRARTGTGIIIEGGIRDLARVRELADFPVYARGVDPSAIADVTLVGVNVPIRIGGATVLPGDVVLGTRAGVTFIPPHLLSEVVEHAEDARERDVWGKHMLDTGRYTSAQIDVAVWAPEIEAAYRAARLEAQAGGRKRT
jgi:4-hydroxy-4-methyl-2-oxoglutarate aldolase